MNTKIYLIINRIKPKIKGNNLIPFFPDLKTTFSRVCPTTTLTGSLLVSGIGSDLTNGSTLPSCKENMIYLKCSRQTTEVKY